MTSRDGQLPAPPPRGHGGVAGHRPRQPSTSDAVDAWLRDQGMPTLVPLPRWSRELPRRIAPLLLMIGLVLVLLASLALVASLFDRLTDTAAAVLVIVVLVALAVIPPLGAWLVHRQLRRLPPRVSTTVSWLIIIAMATLLVVVGSVVDPGGLSSQLPFTIAIVAAVALFLWAGGGALLAWTLRSAVRHLGAIRFMAAIALPVILMLVIFAFFSAEIWQLTSSLSWARTFGVGVVIAVIAALVVLPASRQSIKDAEQDAAVESTPESITELLAVTPLADRRLVERAVARGVPLQLYSGLGRLQRMNVIGVMVLAQLLLGAIFAALQAVLLIVLGRVALTDQVISSWVGSAPTPITIGDISLPFSLNLARAAVFLAMISALSFIISAVSDRQYREHFFDPIMLDVRRVLTVHALTARLRAAGQPPVPSVRAAASRDAQPAPDAPGSAAEALPQ